MTCIIGAKYGDIIWMGCDSQLTSGWDRGILPRDSKVFRVGNLLFGVSGKFRAAQIIKYHLNIPEQGDKFELEYIVSDVVESIRDILKEKGYAHVEYNNESSQNDEILIGYRGELYRVGSNYSAALIVGPFCATGSGEHYAIGAMEILYDTTPNPIHAITRSLEVAAKYNIGVAGPFHVETLE